VLLDHSAVGDAAVIGIPDDDWGEQVLAVVQPAAGHEPTDELADQLLAHCAEHLAAYKRPRRIEFRAELPRTDAGKLYKRQIRDEYWTDLGRRL
jgi:long-chain acyl-CoA synthetase